MSLQLLYSFSPCLSHNGHGVELWQVHIFPGLCLR